MDEGRESNQVEVSPSILGPKIVVPRVYLVSDRANPHIVCRTTIWIDALTFTGSRLEH